MEKNIKDYREKELRNYIIANILLILIGTRKIDSIVSAISEKNVWEAVEVFVGSGVISILVYAYVYIIDCLIPGEIKNSIIWKIKGMPGTRVFSEIRQNNKDWRFSKEIVFEKYSKVYKDIDKAEGGEKNKIENSAWYGAYQRTEKYASVYVSNRDWLLCRDMCVMTIWILLGFITISIILKTICSLRFIFLIIFILIEGLATWFAARNKGNRYVYNVIAKDVYHKEA